MNKISVICMQTTGIQIINCKNKYRMWCCIRSDSLIIAKTRVEDTHDKRSFFPIVMYIQKIFPSRKKFGMHL